MAEPQTATADTADLLRRAGAHHRRGQLAEAEALYREIIAAEPGHFDALHLYGVLMHQRGQPTAALKLIGAALAANVRAAPAHCHYGVVLAVLERYQEALASYQQALALKPDYAEALHNRGNALHALGRADEAIASFAQAIALRPDYRDALVNHAQLLRRAGRARDALASFDRALALSPVDPDLLIARGNTHYALKSYAQALADYDRALALRPEAAPIHNNRGNALRELGRCAEALASFDRALALKPDYAEAINNRGNALLEMNRIEEALADYERALAQKPGFADALINRGNALRYLGRADEAAASFEAALAGDPQMAEAHWNKALLDLSRGELQRGFAGYEWRWRRAQGEAPREFDVPQWRGEEPHGKTILLHAEQGFGDTVQMVRYVPSVAARGATVILEAPDALLPLLARLDGVTQLMGRGDALPRFDLHCPLMSLPLAFGTTLATIPALVPYLRAPTERVAAWRTRLPVGRRVGLVWSGKPSHKNDRNRSILFAQLKPILAQPGVSFVSLQREVRAADVAGLAQWPNLVRIEEALADFADTAAVIEQLDLVIAVDTAVAHLAGALGKPVFVLISYIQDWRWLAGRADSPWYPTARIFRQPAPGDWDSAIAAAARALAAL